MHSCNEACCESEYAPWEAVEVATVEVCPRHRLLLLLVQSAKRVNSGNGSRKIVKKESARQRGRVAERVEERERGKQESRIAVRFSCGIQMSF